MDRAVLELAITNSGGVVPAGEELAYVLEKIAVLEKTGRYHGILDRLAKANVKSNFLATLLEVTYAHHFESSGMQLNPEVKQTPDTPGSVDFRYSYTGGHLDFELRLIQQDSATTEQIHEQLNRKPFFQAGMGASEDLQTICRAQNIILSKIQHPSDGSPRKFAALQDGVINIVVVDTHDLFLGGIDVDDCRLIMFGDPSVPEENRRGAFGLFQEYEETFGAEIRDHCNRFAHACATLHGVMFLFCSPNSGVFDFGLRQYTMWNDRLIDRERRMAAMTEIQMAIPFNEV